jgi:hypothetical protein
MKPCKALLSRGLVGGGTGANAVSIPRPQAYNTLPPPNNYASTPKGSSQSLEGEQTSTENLSCSPHVLYGDVWARFSHRGADVAENSSEVKNLYGNPGRHAQPHTNPKPVFAELATLGSIIRRGKIIW